MLANNVGKLAAVKQAPDTELLVLKENYIKILLEKINPKTVITLIDNSVEFFKISKLLSNKIKFIAIRIGLFNA